MIKLEFRNVDFCGGRKTGEPGEKPSKQGRESTTNSTHIVRESNPGDSGEKRALYRYATHASHKISSVT
jgi:hypothetical protein